MKCDSCKHMRNDAPDLSSPYGEIYCAVGHWCGGPDTEPPDQAAGNIDPWADCPDYEIKPPRRNRDNKP